MKRRKAKLFSAYTTRDRVLKTLGFRSYTSYLKSQLWAHIRSTVMRVKGKFCLCGSFATTVHHNSYHKSVLLGKGDYLNHLFPLCKRCHEFVEYSPQGRKRDMKEVRLALVYLIMDPPKPIKIPKRPKSSCLFKV